MCTNMNYPIIFIKEGQIIHDDKIHTIVQEICTIVQTLLLRK